LSSCAKFLSFLEIARHPLVVSAPHLKDSTIMHYTTNLTRQLSLLSPLCFHGLTNCFFRKLFVFREICVAPRVCSMCSQSSLPLSAWFNVSVACGLFCALGALFAHACLCFLLLTDSFAKYPGVGGQRGRGRNGGRAVSGRGRMRNRGPSGGGTFRSESPQQGQRPSSQNARVASARSQ
jgi:hypothetical protein